MARYELIYGKYYITEIQSLWGYEYFTGQYEIFISEHGATIPVDVTNDRILGGLDMWTGEAPWPKKPFPPTGSS